MTVKSSAHLRTLLGPVLRGAYDVRVSGSHLVPKTGGVLIVSERTGLLDASVLSTSLARPVQVALESRMDFRNDGLWGPLLGRIVKPPGSGLRDVFHRALAAVYAGDAVGAFPLDRIRRENESSLGFLSAYVSACSGVLVVPVSMAGTHGGRPTDPPPFRARIQVTVGGPVALEPVVDSRSRSHIMARAEQIRQMLADHCAQARLRMGG